MIVAMATLLRWGADRILLLATPALACLAAMALPTLHRSISAIIDWFAMLFFAFCGLIIWVIYVSLLFDVPAKPAANVRRLLPGFEMPISGLALIVAVGATIAWIAVIIWRTQRHPAAIWKTLAIAASGAVTCWVLLTSLWMPILNSGRSYAPSMAQVQRHIGLAPCLHSLFLDQSQMTALQFHAGYALLPLDHAVSAQSCPWLIVDANDLKQSNLLMPSHWRLMHTISRRSSSDTQTLLLYQHAAP